MWHRTTALVGTSAAISRLATSAMMISRRAQRIRPEHHLDVVAQLGGPSSGRSTRSSTAELASVAETVT
jgi:hypothetical protein